MVETPEQDRLDNRLDVSGVGRKFGEGEGDREGMCVDEASRSVVISGVGRQQSAAIVGLLGGTPGVPKTG